MNEFEEKMINYLNNTDLEYSYYVDWFFFSVFSKVIEKMNGGVSCDS